jgi:hypothetical protein
VRSVPADHRIGRAGVAYPAEADKHPEEDCTA